MPNIGPMELVVVLVIALVVLGPKRLPSAGKAVGKGIREFKDGVSGLSLAADETEAAPAKRLLETPKSKASVSAIA